GTATSSNGPQVPSGAGTSGGIRSSPATVIAVNGVVLHPAVGEPVHTASEKRHVPFSAPSSSHVGSPSRHTTPLLPFVDVTPLNPMRQSVLASPPPATSAWPPPDRTSRSGTTIARTRITTKTVRRVATPSSAWRPVRVSGSFAAGRRGHARRRDG